MAGRVYSYEDYHREIDGQLFKKCTLHEKYFPTETEWFPATPEYFHPNSNNGFHTYCKKCNNEKSKQWRLEHHETYLQYMKEYNSRPESKIEKSISDKKRRPKIKEWHQTHPEKMKEYRQNREFHKKHEIDKKEWNSCKEYFGNSCACCGLPLEEHLFIRKGKLTKYDFCKDHYINDGVNDLSNCIPLCKVCNSEKSKRIFEEWYNPTNSVFNQDRLNKILQWLSHDYLLYIKEK